MLLGMIGHGARNPFTHSQMVFSYQMLQRRAAIFSINGRTIAIDETYCILFHKQEQPGKGRYRGALGKLAVITTLSHNFQKSQISERMQTQTYICCYLDHLV